MQNGVTLFCCAKTNYIIARHAVYTRRFAFFRAVDRSFSEPCMVCLARIRDQMLLLHSWDNSYLFALAFDLG